MSSLRMFWIAWCVMWALGWLLVGFFTFLLGWLMVPVSLAAILLPVGVDKTYRPPPSLPPCYRCGQPAVAHRPDGACPVDLTSMSGDVDVR